MSIFYMDCFVFYPNMIKIVTIYKNFFRNLDFFFYEISSGLW